MGDSRTWTDIGGWSAGGALYWMGREMRKQQIAERRGVQAQEKARVDAEGNMMRQERVAQEAMNRANRKTPDRDTLLKSAMADSNKGPAGTMLTGYNPIGAAPTNNSRPSLLGG